ncbi:DPP IV N-terminal domain-containing protein [Prosthecobacter sp.]|uniref:DPP IV N-terminal domain-containing protein n=1 Tax=Prosthecobacter sp. TaxID=1965333 RepID=UPI0037830CF1
MIPRPAMKHLAPLCLFVLLSALHCLGETTKVTLQTKRSWDFTEDGVTFSNEFSGARLSDCERVSPQEYRITIAPENVPVNPSPWYAFKITSKKPQSVTLRFNVTAKGAVITPRLSHDGKTWALIDKAAFTPVPKSREALQPERAVATLKVGPETLWVAAQEMVGLAESDTYVSEKARLPFVKESVIGESIEHRPIRQFIFSETTKPDYVFIICRQHPPEITGTLAMQHFIDVLANDSELSQKYRKSFQTVLIPVVNPDGIEHGHWRHNLGGVDTNRDWKDFSQQETRVVRDALLKLGKAPDARVFLFVDFHSTGGDVLYTPPEDAETFPPNFATQWYNSITARFPDYKLELNNAHNVGIPTSKAWAYDTFGCPGITYELGYSTDRKLIKETTSGAAEEMMKLLLEEAAKPKTDPALLTLDRIFTAKEFQEEKLEAIRWSKLGSYYFTLDETTEKPDENEAAENKDDEKKKGKDLVRNEVKTGEKTIIASAKILTPKGEKKPLSVDSYEFSKDESQVLLFANTKKVWRKNTRGDYWVLNVKTQTLRKLGGDTPAATMMFAKFSPDGTRVAYVQKNNLKVQKLADLKITSLTTDGSDTLINGSSDWVNEEELGLRDGFVWSPDGTRLLFWQFDTKDVKNFTLVNQTEGMYPSVSTFPYPKAGEKNSAARLGVIPVTGGAVTWLKVPGDPREHYLPKAEWTPDGKSVLLQQFNRLQNTLKVMRADPATGTTKIVLTETDKAWVENNNKIEWIGDDFLWLSERSGWRHAYRVNPAGEVTSITQGEFDLIDVAHLDEKGGWLYFYASPQNATQRYLFRVSVKGGEPQWLSPADQPGTHGYDISEDAQWAVHTRSSFTSPPVIQLISLPDHAAVRVLKAQTKLIEKLGKLKMPKTEFLRVDADGGLSFDAFCITAQDMDASVKHPLLMNVYGEPAGQTVKDAWGGQKGLWHWMLAQQGYVVASVDTRGTPSPRGREWRRAIYLKLGIMNSADEAAGTRALLKRFSYLDPKRVGIWGWSGGGSSSLDAIFRYPDLYQTAMAVAPVPDRKLYDTIYEERYMGLPKDNADGYRLGSPITHAAALKGNLLIVHGTGDDNVHYQGTEKLINELVGKNKHFSVMPYPNRDHAINSGKGTTRHLYELMTKYLEQRLPVH